MRIDTYDVMVTIEVSSPMYGLRDTVHCCIRGHVYKALAAAQYIREAVADAFKHIKAWEKED